MRRPLWWRWRLVGAAAAVSAATVLAVPAGASAANTLSLGVEPGIPGKGKPFEVIARGTADGNGPSACTACGQYGVYLSAYFAPGRRSCATTPVLESANPANLGSGLSGDLEPGPYERRGLYNNGLDDSIGFKSGLPAGRYRACGYLTKNFRSGEVLTRARLDFTVGGTCASSKKRVTRAAGAVKRAKRALKRAKTSGSAGRIRRARKKLRKAQKTLKTAKADRKALC